MKQDIVKLVRDLIRYLCILAVLFFLTLPIPAESYGGMIVFMFMLGATSAVILTIIQLIYIGVICLLNILRSGR